MAQEVVYYRPTEKQKVFLEAVLSKVFKVVFYGGAIRGGKTYALLGTVITLCLLYAGSKYVVCRANLERIKTTVLPTFEKFKSLISYRIVQEPSQSNSWTCIFDNGSQIVFFAENIEKDPDLLRFRGLEYDGIAFDETDVQEKTFRMGIQRAGTWRMDERMKAMKSGDPVPPQVVMCSSNPQQNWVKLEIHDKHINGTLPESWKYIESKVYDNPHISEEWIETLRNELLPEDFAMMVDGDWEINLNDSPFFEYLRDSRAEIDWDDQEELLVSFDFNVDNCAATIFQVIPFEAIHVMRSYLVPGGTREACQAIKKDIDISKYWLKITGDASGRSGSSYAGIDKDTGEKLNNYTIIADELDLRLDRKTFISNKANSEHQMSRTLCNEALYRVPIFFNTGTEKLFNDLKKARAVSNDKGKIELYKNRGKGYEMDLADTFRYGIEAIFKNHIGKNATIKKSISSFYEDVKSNNPELLDEYQKIPFISRVKIK